MVLSLVARKQLLSLQLSQPRLGESESRQFLSGEQLVDSKASQHGHRQPQQDGGSITWRGLNLQQPEPHEDGLIAQQVRVVLLLREPAHQILFDEEEV